MKHYYSGAMLAALFPALVLAADLHITGGDSCKPLATPTGSKRAQGHACLNIDPACVARDENDAIVYYLRDQCFITLAENWDDENFCNFITLGPNTPELRRACQIATSPMKAP